MRSLMFGLLIVGLTAVACPPVSAGGGDGHKHGHAFGGVFCPRCKEPCEVTVSKGTEKKYCWEVECKKICIPRVTFPWQKCETCVCGKGGKDGKGGDCVSCVQPKCGRTKYVRVLRKHEYECSTCKYSWAGDGKGGGNGKGKYKSGGGGAPAGLQPTPEAPMPPSPTVRYRIPERSQPEAKPVSWLRFLGG